jgi:hypothetical protein
MLIPIKRNIEIAEGVRRNNTTILQENLISLDKQDLLDNSNKLSDNPSKLLYLLMTILPPRRLDDYRTMTFGVSDGNHFDTEYMYITEANTKNKKSITIKIPDELLHLIPTSGFLLGKYYSQPVLSNRFASIMTQVYGRKIGALQLRRIFLTHFNKQGGSFLERKIIADAVGHSVEESVKYSVKIIN